MRRLLAALLTVALCGACASYSELRFVPAVNEAELRDGNEVQARVSVAWLGVGEGEGGQTLHFRVRIENPTSGPFPLEPAKFELLDAVLVPFGPPFVSGLPASLAPGESVTFELAFPVPAGRSPDGTEFDALQLRTQLDGNRWAWSTQLRRTSRYAYTYPYPYYGSCWGPGWGY